MHSDVTSPDDAVELPPEFAEHVAKVSGLDTPPATLEEWWSAMLDQFESGAATVGLTDLYAPTTTPHEVQVGPKVKHAYCALDALAAAVMEPHDEVTVRSADPVTGTTVRFAVHADDSVDVSPEGALICFGADISEDAVDEVGSLAEWAVQDDKADVRASVCQYTLAFESETTYEQWATDRGIVTLPLAPADAMPFLQQLPRSNP